jgi:hypothetical protein
MKFQPPFKLQPTTKFLRTNIVGYINAFYFRCTTNVKLIQSLLAVCFSKELFVALERMEVNGKSEQMKDVIDPSPRAKTKVVSTRIGPLFCIKKTKKQNSQWVIQNVCYT